MVNFEDPGGGGLTPEEEEERRKRELYAAILREDAARQAAASRAAGAEADALRQGGTPAPDLLTPLPEPAAARAADPNLRDRPRDVLPDTPGFVPGPDEAPVIDYEEEAFVPAPEPEDFEDEPFTRQDLLEAFPEEFLDQGGERPLDAESFLPDDTSFELPPPSDDLVLPEIPDILEAPPVPEDYFLDREAEEQPPAPTVAALTDGVSYLTLEEEARRRRTEEARLEGLDFLYLPEGPTDVETDLLDFRIREGGPVTFPEGPGEPLPPGAEAGGLLPGGQEAFPSTGGPELTVDRLAQLPDLSQFGFVDLPELPGLAALQPGAREITAARDQPDLTPEAFRDLAIGAAPDLPVETVDAWLTSPDGQAAFGRAREDQAEGRRIAQSEIDRINQGLSTEAARERSIARVNAAQEGQRATASIDIGAAEPLVLTGRAQGGVFTPDDPVRITEEEQAEFIARLREQGLPVSEIAQPRDENPVQAAAKGLLGLAGRGIEATRRSTLPGRALGVKDTVISGDTTLLEQALRPFTWLEDRTREQAMQPLFRLQQLGGPADRDLAGALGTISRTRQRNISEAWVATLADDGEKRALAQAIREGKSDVEINQRFSSFWKELTFAAIVDLPNLLVPGANSVRALRGLDTASGLINLRGRTVDQGLKNALQHVSDAEAVAPWERTTGTLDPRVLFRRAPGVERRDILGTASQDARGSTARVVASEIAGLMEKRAAQNIDDLEPIWRSLATQGGDATAAQYFRGIGATRVLQDARFVAPDVVTQLDTPGSALRTAIDKPVYSGPGSYFDLPAAEKAKYYADDLEKLKDVTDEFEGSIRRANRTHFGLDPEADGAIVRAQQAMRGVLSRVYLLNPRYYIRNGLGDEVTARSFGLSTFGSTKQIDDFLVNTLNDTTTRMPSGVSGEAGLAAGAKGFLRRLSNQENRRGRTVYGKQTMDTWNGLRAVTWEDGFDAIRDIPGADRIRDGVRSARSPRDLDALITCDSPCRISAPMRASRVLDDADDGLMLPPLRSALDGLADRAVRGQPVERAITKALSDTAAHANQAAKHFGGRAITVDDFRRLDGEVDALVQQGMPRPEAQARVLAGWADGHMADIRAAGIRQEISERISTGPFKTQFRQEWRDLQVQHPALGARNLADGAMSPEARQAMDTLLVKMRTAQNGIATVGANGAKRARSVDDLAAVAQQKVDAAQAKVDAVIAREANPPTRPAGRQRITVTKDTPQWQQWREGQRVDWQAFRGIQNEKWRAMDELRDAEDALANLQGRPLGGRFTQPRADGSLLGDESTATAATAAAVQSAKDALTILAFQKRLPGAVTAWRTLPEAIELGSAYQVAPRGAGALSRAADVPQGPPRPGPQGRPIRLGEPPPPELPTGARPLLPPGRPQPGRTIPLGSAGPVPSWAGPIELGPEFAPGPVPNFIPGVTLTPAERDAINAYIARQKDLYLRDQVAAKEAARRVTDYILHNYGRTYDYDFLLRWIAPWELWTSRTLAKLPLRMADHPAYFSKVAILRDAMRDANADLPEWLQERVKIPIPWAPDFLGDNYFFDPVKLFLPTDMLDSFVRDNELETKQGKARAAMGFMGQNPGPIADMLMALAPGGMNWWETQERNPVVSVWSGIVPAINKVTGANIPVNPVYQEKHYKAATRILFQKSVAEGWDEERYRTAIEDLRRNETTGVRLRAPGLENEDAVRALQEAQTRYTLPSLMSMFGAVGSTFTRQWEDDAFALSKQYFDTRKDEGPEAARAFLEQNPDLQRFWLTGEGKQEALREIANARYFTDIERANTTYRTELEKLPLRGTDKDRRQLREARDREIFASAALLKQENADWQPPERKPNLVQGIADALFDLPVVRDSGGVLDWEATVEQRNSYLKALEQAPRTEGDQILMELAPENLRPQVEAAMRPKTPDGALNQVIDSFISKGWEDRAAAGEGATTREQQQKAVAEFEANWKLPSRDELVNYTATVYPELFGPGARYTGADLYTALDGALTSTLAEASTASEEQRRQKFFANLDPETGASSEPFYANKAAGVVIRTEADYQRMQKGRADDEQFDTRRAANDPTYRLFGTDDRAWLQGGEPLVALNRLSNAIYEWAAGPIMPNGNPDPSKAKGWNSQFTFPNGEKMRPWDALQLVNKQRDDYYESIYGTRLPSESDDEAKAQTAASNAAARSAGGTSGGRSRPRRAASGYAAPRRSTGGGGGTSSALGPSPSVPAVKWINDGVLTRTRLTGVDAEGNLTVNLRDEWRKGTGLTPEKWTAFLAKHPGVDAAISQAEGLHAGIAADPNGVTSAIHEQALVVQTALEEARALDAERKAGIQVSGLTNITEQLVSSKSIRKGTADLARAFRTGTSGLGTEAKWSEFLGKHPDLGAAIAQAQAQVDALTTEDEAPDDLAQLEAVYEVMRTIGDQITELRALDRQTETERLTALREAGTQLREEQRAEMRTFQTGAVIPSIDEINDAWLQPARLRRGATDFDRAFRLGSGLADTNAWTAFLGRNPAIKNAIDGLNEGAKQFVTKAVAPRDAEAMTAFYDSVAAVAAQITAAQEAEAEAKRQATRTTRRQERVEDDTIVRGSGEPGVGFFTARAAARKKKRRDEEEE